MSQNTEVVSGTPSAVPEALVPTGHVVERDPRDPEARLDSFFDAGPRLIVRPDAFPDAASAEGMVAQVGNVNGRQVVCFASDPRVSGGALGIGSCAVVVEAYAEALRRGAPVVGLWHSGGARLDQGIRSLHAVGTVFEAMTRASGRIPQISVVLGAAAGGAAYGPALTDVVIQAPAGKIFVTGPDVVRSAIGEEVTADDLGGLTAHGTHSGVTHVTVEDETSAYLRARELCGLLGTPGSLDVLSVEDLDLATLLPERPNVVYDVRNLVRGVLDSSGDVVELQEGWARNVVTLLGRLGGRTVGVVANNPAHLVGCLDSVSAEKASRFVRLCDAFGVPIIVLVDVPGYLPGSSEELGGIVRRGAKLLHAFAEAVVPTVTIVTRKAYGGAYIAMNSSSLGAHASFAWPGAEIAVMSPLSAVRILHRRVLAAANEAQRYVLEKVLADEHAAAIDGVAAGLEHGILDAVVRPDETRSRIAKAIAAGLSSDPDPRGTHTNIPL